MEEKELKDFMNKHDLTAEYEQLGDNEFYFLEHDGYRIMTITKEEYLKINNFLKETV